MKLYRNIIIVVILLAALGGAMYFVSNYTPAEQAESTESKAPDESSDMISVYKAEIDDVTKIYVKNAREEYTLERIEKNWVLNGDPTIKIRQTAADSVAFSCTSVSVKQIVAETDENAANFGFFEPTGFAELTFHNGTKKKITV